MTPLQEKLKLGETIPYFNLPSARNDQINPWDFKQRRNLIIFFHHGILCLHCAVKLDELSSAYTSLKENETELLAISCDDITSLKDYTNKLMIPCHLLSDKKAESIKQFTYSDPARKATYPPIFITDRFGMLRFQQINLEAHSLAGTDEILSWLILIQTECPERSHL